MKFDIVTLFPSMFDSPLNESILKRAVDSGLIEIKVHNLRDYTSDKHHTVDDSPYGGGAGMIMKPGPVVEAIERLKSAAASQLAAKCEHGVNVAALSRQTAGVPAGDSTVILLSPQGRRYDQKMAQGFSLLSHIILICGRYEGIDERVAGYVDETVSIGDFVLTGGELAAMTVVDSVSRLVPGVLGSDESSTEESFSWHLLEYPQFTRPNNFRGLKVPEILLSGNHGAIRKWRRKEALRKTMQRRPDLLEKIEPGSEDLALMDEIKMEAGAQIKNDEFVNNRHFNETDNPEESGS